MECIYWLEFAKQCNAQNKWFNENYGCFECPTENMSWVTDMVNTSCYFDSDGELMPCSI